MFSANRYQNASDHLSCSNKRVQCLSNMWTAESIAVETGIICSKSCPNSQGDSTGTARSSMFACSISGLTANWGCLDQLQMTNCAFDFH